MSIILVTSVIDWFRTSTSQKCKKKQKINAPFADYGYVHSVDTKFCIKHANKITWKMIASRQAKTKCVDKPEQ